MYFLKDYANKLDALKNFAIRDLERDATPYLEFLFEKMREVRALIEQDRLGPAPALAMETEPNANVARH